MQRLLLAGNPINKRGWTQSLAAMAVSPLWQSLTPCEVTGHRPRIIAEVDRVLLALPIAELWGLHWIYLLYSSPRSAHVQLGMAFEGVERHLDSTALYLRLSGDAV